MEVRGDTLTEGPSLCPAGRKAACCVPHKTATGTLLASGKGDCLRLRIRAPRT